MRHKKFNTFITEDEFDLIDYQNIIYDLFKYAKKHWNETK